MDQIESILPDPTDFDPAHAERTFTIVASDVLSVVLLNPCGRARATQATTDFQARYALRADVEGTIRQGVAVTGMRHARYRGLARTRLEHTNVAVALNLIRLHAWWNGHPLDRTRTSHLARLELALAS